MSAPKFDTMNETDVREIIVRPLLARLGYAHGTEANIRTEQSFRYGRAFLGRKSPGKDPDLVGRADYILEVTSYGRWVVEVKAPSEGLTRDVVEQAHTYAAHPEVAALFFLVTNGREFQLYRTSALTTPVMAWAYEDMDEMFLAFSNLISPETIKRKMTLLAADPGKPLGPGVASTARIIGGFVRYEDHVANHKLLGAELVNGLELPITGGEVKRGSDGRLHALLKLAKTAPLFNLMGDDPGREDDYDFYASDEYVSTDIAHPTIFQNLYDKYIAAGTPMPVPGLGTMPMPFGFRNVARTEAIGFIDGDTFKGTMQISYEVTFDTMPLHVRAALEQFAGPIPPRPSVQGGGVFEVKLLTL